jgi:hypothetical protein
MMESRELGIGTRESPATTTDVHTLRFKNTQQETVFHHSPFPIPRSQPSKQ